MSETPPETPVGLLRELFRPVELGRPTGGTMATRGAWGLLGTASQGGLRFVSNLVVGHVVGRAALGVFQGAISVALLLSLLWPTSIGSAASKFLAQSRGAGNHTQTAAVAAHLARRNIQVTLALAVAAAGYWRWHSPGASVLDLVSLAALLVGYCGYAFTRGVQYGVGQVRRGTLWDAIASSLGLVALLVLVLAGVRGLPLLLALAVSYGLYTVACWPHGAHGTLDRPLRREIDGFITLAAVGTLLSSGFLQLAMVVARATASADDAGLFAAAMTLATPASLLTGSLSLVLFPTMAEAWGRGNREQFRIQTDLATRGLFSVMIGVFGVIVLCSRLIVDVLWGESYEGSATVLPILLTAVCLSTLAMSSTNAIMIMGPWGLRVMTAAGVVGVVLGILVWWLTADSWGIIGIAVGYLCSNAVIFTVNVGLCWRLWRHRWTSLAARTVLAAAGVAGLTWLSADNAWGGALQVVLAAAFLAVWLTACLPDLRMALTRRPRA